MLKIDLQCVLRKYLLLTHRFHLAAFPKSEEMTRLLIDPRFNKNFVKSSKFD